MPTSLERIPPTKQLQTLDLVTPGHLGVNTIQASSLLDPTYCITANNAVIDTSGRLAARFGVVRQTQTPVGVPVNILAPGGVLASLLIHADGTNGSTTFTDSSANLLTLTATGGAQVSTTAPKFGTGAYVNSGGSESSPASVSTPIVASGPLDLHGVDWTIEFWAKYVNSGTAINTAISLQVQANGNGFRIYYDPPGGLWRMQDLNGPGSSAGPSITTNDGQWHAIAVCCISGITQVYVDGMPGTASTATSSMVTGDLLLLGASNNSSIQDTYWGGGLDEIQVTKGLGKYTGAYTPATAPFTGSVSNAQGATSGVLAVAWAGTSGQYTIYWDTGQQTLGTLTNGSTAVTWTPGLFTATAGAGVVLTTPILSSFEYNQGNGSFQELVAWSGGISNNVSAPYTNQIQGSVNVTNGQWYFQNFNNKVIGFQAGQKPIVWNGTGNFATVVESAGTAPTGGIGTSAFGRLWCVDADGQTIKYSGLLDETDWSTTDGNAGIIDMHTIWSNGTDTVTAIAAFNASLVVFGTNHIVFFTDGRGSLLGLDPTQAYVFDTIFSTGCYSQWTVQNIGQGDMLFLGPNGVQSLSNLNTNRSFPQGNVSKYIRDTLLSQLAAETTATIRSSYNNLTGQYYLCLPNNGLVWCIDMRRAYTDQMGETCAVCTPWSMRVTTTNSTHNNLTYFARTIGTIGLYSGNTDEGQPYVFTYLSPWLNLGEEVAQHLKMLKRMEAIVFAGGAQSITFAYNTDFNKTAQSVVLNVNSSGANSQYAIGQYGIAQYGGGSTLALLKYPAHARGQYYQVGLASTVANIFALQQIQLAVKVGRVA